MTNKKIKKECKQCGKEIFIYPSLKIRKKFCSRKCKNENQKEIKRKDIWNSSDKIKEMYSNDKKFIWQIANFYDCSTKLINDILKRNNIQVNSRKNKDIWDKKDLIINEYNNGFSTPEICKEFKCSYSLINNILKENNIEIRRNKIFWNKQEEIIRMYNAGISIKKISEIIGCKSRKIIDAILRKNNIIIRPQKYYLKGKPSPLKLILPEEDIINKYLNENISGTKIAKQFNCANSVIYNILNNNHIKIKEKGFFINGKKSKKRLNLDEKEIVNLYRKNISSPKIAKKFSCSISVILRILRENEPQIIHKNVGFYLKGKNYQELFGKEKAEERRENFRLRMKGKNNPNYGIKVSQDRLNKQSEKMKKLWKDKHPAFYSEERNRKIGEAHLGEKNVNWNGGSSFEPYTPEFNKIFKLAIKQRDGFSCLKCGMREEDHIKLFGAKENVHHIDYIKENTFKENCCILCRRCNLEVNSNRKSWTKFFQSLLHEKYGYEYSENGDIILNFVQEKLEQNIKRQKKTLNTLNEL